MSGTDDERFAEIVAGFERDSDQPVPPWPVSEDVGEADSPPVVEGWVVPRPVHPEPVADLPDWLEPDALPDDGHFEPPPPPRVPRLRPRTLAAVGMVLVGLAVLFAPYRIGLDDSTGWLVIGLALMAGGAGLLVAWMRDAPATGDDPDDGAVV